MKYLGAIINKGFVTPESRGMLEKYEKGCTDEGLTERTIRQNCWTIERILGAMGKPIEDIKPGDLDDYFATLGGKKVTYLNHQKATMKAFFHKIGKKRIYGSITLLKEKRKQRENRLPKHLVGRDDLIRILRSCDSERDKALVFFLYESGCRKSEALDMKKSDLVADEYGFTAVVRGKTGERRIRIIEAAQDMKNYLNNHPGSHDDPHGPLWCSLSKRSYGRKMNHDSLFRLFKRIGKRAKLEYNLHPHLLRHSRATELAAILTEHQMDVLFGWEFGSSMPSTYIERGGVNIDDRLLEAQGIKRPERKQMDMLKAVCPECGKPQSPAASFCYSCGAILETESAKNIKTKAPARITEEMLEEKLEEMINERLDKILKEKGEKLRA